MRKFCFLDRYVESVSFIPIFSKWLKLKHLSHRIAIKNKIWCDSFAHRPFLRLIFLHHGIHLKIIYLWCFINFLCICNHFGGSFDISKFFLNLWNKIFGVETWEIEASILLRPLRNPIFIEGCKLGCDWLSSFWIENTLSCLHQWVKN